ncbi:hypothetical protein ACLOJK_028647 [Asimina triloba]
MLSLLPEAPSHALNSVGSPSPALDTRLRSRVFTRPRNNDPSQPPVPAVFTYSGLFSLPPLPSPPLPSPVLSSPCSSSLPCLKDLPLEQPLLISPPRVFSLSGTALVFSDSSYAARLLPFPRSLASLSSPRHPPSQPATFFSLAATTHHLIPSLPSSPTPASSLSLPSPPLSSPSSLPSPPLSLLFFPPLLSTPSSRPSSLLHAGPASSALLEYGNVLPIKVHRNAMTGQILNLIFVWADAGSDLAVDLPVVFKGEDVCPGLKKGVFFLLTLQ